MTIQILPKSKLGHWSLWLSLLFFVFLGLFFLLAPFAPSSGPEFFDTPLLAFALLLAAIGAIASLLISLISVFKNRERSLLLAFPILIGIFVIYFLLGEFVSPH